MSRYTLKPLSGYHMSAWIFFTSEQNRMQNEDIYNLMTFYNVES
jgi:hypothetical protein